MFKDQTRSVIVLIKHIGALLKLNEIFMKISSFLNWTHTYKHNKIIKIASGFRLPKSH